MKITVIGANGATGRRVVAEAVRRGHEVTAITRGANRSQAQSHIQREASAITATDLEGADAVVDALGFFAPEQLDQHVATSQHFADLLSGTDVRLVVVGGAGSLYLDPEHTTQLLESEDFPAEFRPLAKAQADQLAALRQRDDVAWTFISPAAVYDQERPATGKVQVAGEQFTLNERGESVLSYDDYAAALVDELESTQPHLRSRISLLEA